MDFNLGAKAILFLGCLLGVVSFAPTVAQNLTFHDVKKVPVPAGAKRISYGSDASQFGELRLPSIKGAYPVAVVIHGGCWYSDYDLSQVANFNASLTGLGVATWSGVSSHPQSRRRMAR